ASTNADIRPVRENHSFENEGHIDPVRAPPTGSASGTSAEPSQKRPFGADGDSAESPRPSAFDWPTITNRSTGFGAPPPPFPPSGSNTERRMGLRIGRTMGRVRLMPPPAR